MNLFSHEFFNLHPIINGIKGMYFHSKPQLAKIVVL